MKRSSSVISLTLLGSAVFLAGCSRRTDDEERRSGQGGVRVTPGFGRAIGGAIGGRGAAPSVGASARGGFGGIGAGLSAGS